MKMKKENTENCAEIVHKIGIIKSNLTEDQYTEFFKQLVTARNKEEFWSILDSKYEWCIK